MDIYNRDKWFTRAFAEFDKEEETPEKQLIKNFMLYQKGRNLSWERLTKFLRITKELSKMLGKPFEQAAKEDIILLVDKIRETNYNEWTKRDYRVVLRMFYGWLWDMDNKNSNLRELKDFVYSYVKTTVKQKKPISVSDILTPEEVMKIIAATKNLRDRALFAVLYYSMARIGEILPLKFKDIEFVEAGCKLFINGTKNSSSIRQVLITEEPAASLKLWIESHPFRNDLNAPLFVSYDSPEKPIMMSYAAAYKALIEAVSRAKINKPIHPHILRHSRVSSLFKKLNKMELKRMGGWSPSSKVMEEVYIHFDDASIHQSLIEAEGKKVKDEEKTAAAFAKVLQNNPRLMRKIVDALMKEKGKL